MPGRMLGEHREVIKTSWLQNNYLDMLSVYLAQKPPEGLVEKFVFQPLLAISELSSANDRQEAAAIFALVERRHTDQIDEAVERGRKEFEDALPANVPEAVRGQLLQKWLTQNYLTSIKDVVQGEECGYVFTPIIALEELPTAGKQEEAARLLKLMTPSLAQCLTEKVQ